MKKIRSINNIIFKGADFAELANCVEIHENRLIEGRLEVYVELLLSMHNEINEQIQCFEDLLINTTEIGFSEGVKGSYISHFKDIKHLYTENLGFKITPNKALTYKKMAVFRNK